MVETSTLAFGIINLCVVSAPFITYALVKILPSIISTLEAVYVPVDDRGTEVVSLVVKVYVTPLILVVNLVSLAIVKEVGVPAGVNVKFNFALAAFREVGCTLRCFA